MSLLKMYFWIHKIYLLYMLMCFDFSWLFLGQSCSPNDFNLNILSFQVEIFFIRLTVLANIHYKEL